VPIPLRCILTQQKAALKFHLNAALAEIAKFYFQIFINRLPFPRVNRSKIFLFGHAKNILHSREDEMTLDHKLSRRECQHSK